jgi:tRNA-specific 2-thiouridylase
MAENLPNQRKAVALISGGLDSMLAAKCLLEQGIHVEGLNFYTGFCVEGHTHAIRQKDKNKQKRNNALWVAEQLGIKLHIIDIVEEYKNIVLNPQHGYGAYLNPCLDCKVFMIKKANEWRIENGFDFIITGEVVGQRPKSQKKSAMPIVAEQSGVGDLLLRPLCAQKLPPTLPEREGWVDRNQLFDISGRSRKTQMALAEQYAFNDYAQPAGGCCFLTNEHYSAKLMDLWQSQGCRQYELDDIMLLKIGRHLRPAPHYKLIIGREQGENKFLEGYRKQFISLTPLSHKGPLVLIDGTPTENDCVFASRILGRFSDCQHPEQLHVSIRLLDGTTNEIWVDPLSSDDMDPEWSVERRGIPIPPKRIPLKVQHD